jgi:hydroxymethylglutaryl-CoA lyase
LAVHFHDTFDNAIENILTATIFGTVYFLLSGIRVVDSSIGGLGGCPYSMKPVGNVCT